MTHSLSTELIETIRASANRLGAPGIAKAISQLITDGELQAGSRLPTVRQLAAELHVSPSTVATAWRELARNNMIQTHRRGGTRVRGGPKSRAPRRAETIFSAVRTGRFTQDLSRQVPDPSLLPPIAKAFDYAVRREHINNYLPTAITPSLEDALDIRRPDHRALAVNGGYAGLSHLVRALITTGDTVAVEEPTSPRILDIIEWAGGTIVPVGCDEDGPRPDELKSAVQSRKPSIFIFQSRAQSPTGHSVPASRIAEYHQILRTSDVATIEIDSQPYVCQSELHLLADLRPSLGYQVKSFSKPLGPDLRLGVIIGPADTIDQIFSLRSFAEGWTSQIIQEAAAWLITDPGSLRSLERARSTYAERRMALASALRAEGFRPRARDGLSVWVPVPNEYAGVALYAAYGIAVQPGRPAFFRRAPQGFLRLAASRLTSGYAEIAAVLRDLADGSP